MKRIASTALFALAAALSLTSGAWAQYKVVQPDGSVTYTDKPPAPTNARVTSLNRRGTTLPPDTAATNSGLPMELRQAAQRYPVTLYSSPECVPCDNGRRFLQQRGIPYAEKRVSSEEDALALERAVGGRTVPALTIGAQPLRGFSETDWTAFLDAAGYPRESRLPRNWAVQPAQPLTEKAAPPAPAPAPARPEPAPVEAPEIPASGTRF
jgi:glutaredoxin